MGRHGSAILKHGGREPVYRPSSSEVIGWTDRFISDNRPVRLASLPHLLHRTSCCPQRNNPQILRSPLTRSEPRQSSNSGIPECAACVFRAESWATLPRRFAAIRYFAPESAGGCGGDTVGRGTEFEARELASRTPCFHGGNCDATCVARARKSMIAWSASRVFICFSAIPCSFLGKSLIEEIRGLNFQIQVSRRKHLQPHSSSPMLPFTLLPRPMLMVDRPTCHVHRG